MTTVRSVAVRAEELAKTYGKIVALAGLTLAMDEGELFCVLGPNGAGKTTFLLLLATVLKPTSGRLIVLGRNVLTDGDAIRQHVGIAFQEPKLFWRHTVQEMIDFHIAMCGLGQAGARRAAEVLESLELAPLRGRRGLELSGGQQKRLEVARVLVQRPALAIFDEPTAGIDLVGKHIIWREVQRLKASGTTVVLATNDVYEGEHLGDRIVIVDRGRLIACGELQTLRKMIPQGEVADLIFADKAVPRVLELLGGFEGVVNLKPLGETSLRMYLTDGQASVPRILQHLLQARIPVTSLKMTNASLDDVFLQLTGREMPKA